MKNQIRKLSDVLSNWPVNTNKNDLLQLEQLIAKDYHKIVVLDDDPTGVQTVHGVSVYTTWDVDSLCAAMQEDRKLFYILTNSRGLVARETEKLHHEIVRNVYDAARKCGKEPIFISRSDSTLRGHYPLETDIIRQEIEQNTRQPVHGEILFPFFKEGGRYTLEGTHYVRYGNELVPAAQTEFAKDRTFGYNHSYLPDYIREKTKGNGSADRIVCITLEQLRSKDIGGIVSALTTTKDFCRYCVDALDYSDVVTFCIALYLAMQKGRRFVFRTAASFVKVMGGISDQPLLSFEKSENNRMGGLVVVGSHTDKTTRQLEKLLKMPGTVRIPFRAETLLQGEEAFENEISRCIAAENKALEEGKIAVCYTERTIISRPTDTKNSALERSVKISNGVQRLVSGIRMKPTFIVAKGGITSSDIGTKALRVKRAEILGQIVSGVPVWELGSESLFPGIPYVIFPGNVGDDDSLLEAVRRLCALD